MYNIVTTVCQLAYILLSQLYLLYIAICYICYISICSLFAITDLAASYLFHLQMFWFYVFVLFYVQICAFVSLTLHYNVISSMLIPVDVIQYSYLFRCLPFFKRFVAEDRKKGKNQNNLRTQQRPVKLCHHLPVMLPNVATLQRHKLEEHRTNLVEQSTP